MKFYTWALVAALVGCGGGEDKTDDSGTATGTATGTGTAAGTPTGTATGTPTGTPTGTATGTATGSTTTSPTDTGPSACTVLPDGTYGVMGAAFGMPMDVDLTFDAASCSFTLTNWSMVMGSVPDAGTVSGNTVTLSGSDPYWATCSGNILPAGDAFGGMCTQDGAQWGMSL